MGLFQQGPVPYLEEVPSYPTYMLCSPEPCRVVPLILFPPFRHSTQRGATSVVPLYITPLKMFRVSYQVPHSTAPPLIFLRDASHATPVATLDDCITHGHLYTSQDDYSHERLR